MKIKNDCFKHYSHREFDLFYVNLYILIVAFVVLRYHISITKKILREMNLSFDWHKYVSYVNKEFFTVLKENVNPKA